MKFKNINNCTCKMRMLNSTRQWQSETIFKRPPLYTNPIPPVQTALIMRQSSDSVTCGPETFLKSKTRKKSRPPAAAS